MHAFNKAWMFVARLLIVITACGTGMFVEWQRPELFSRIDESLRDLFVQATANAEPETRVVVVDISEDSLREVAPWPWSRSRIADLVEILLSKYGVRAVGLDMVLPEPADSEGDARLAALAAHAPLVLAQIFDFTSRDKGLQQGVLTGGRAADNLTSSVSAYGYLANHAGLHSARCVGNIGYVPDGDGVLRRIPVRTVYAGLIYAPFAEVMMACVPPAVLPKSGYRAQSDERGFWRIPFARRLEGYAVIPAHMVLSEAAPVDLLRGRYVLVGSSSLSLGDRASTSLSPLVAGVMIHAAALTALLDGQAASPLSEMMWRGILLIWIGLSVSFLVLAFARYSAWRNVALICVLSIVWLVLGLWGGVRGGEWSVVAPLCAYVFLLLTAIPFEWWQTQHKAQKLINTFSHYVAWPVLDEIMKRGLDYSLTPTLKEVTVLIADMEGYTNATSSMSLDDAATLTKGFLECLTRPVLEGGGTLDKYSGDGLVAFWGAPLPCDDQADRAVDAAGAILESVDRFNADRVALGLLPVRVRVGIESGMALVGDLGTRFRSTYTAVGDCINFASRLETAARDLPTRLVIGAAANGKLRRHATCPLGTLSLRGTQTEIEIYTLQGVS